MTAHGGRNDYIRLDTGLWACRWLWLTRRVWEDPVETATLLGCAHGTEEEAAEHVRSAAAARAVLYLVDPNWGQPGKARKRKMRS